MQGFSNPIRERFAFKYLEKKWAEHQTGTGVRESNKRHTRRVQNSEMPTRRRKFN